MVLQGEVAGHCRIDTKSYTSLHALVNGIFPPTSSNEQVGLQNKSSNIFVHFKYVTTLQFLGPRPIAGGFQLMELLETATPNSMTVSFHIASKATFQM